MEKLKTEYADKFNIYRDTLAKYKDTEKTYRKIKDSYKEFQEKREEVSKENHRLFQNESTNGDKIEKELTFDKAIISLEDRIIPSKNQIAFWENKTKIQTINSTHCPFECFKSWDELL